MDYLRWLKIEVLFEVTSRLNNTEEEDDVLKEIRYKDNGVESYERGYDFIGPEDFVVNLAQGCLLPKNKKKIYYTIIALKSGNIHYAVGKSEDVYKMLNEYELSLKNEN